MPMIAELIDMRQQETQRTISNGIGKALKSNTLTIMGQRKLKSTTMVFKMMKQKNGN